MAAGPAHGLRFEPQPANGGLKPYLHVRGELWAKVTRALYYDLVDLGEERTIDGKAMFGVVSGGEFFAMAGADCVRMIPKSRHRFRKRSCAMKSVRAYFGSIALERA